MDAVTDDAAARLARRYPQQRTGRWWIPVAILAAEALAIAVSPGEVDSLVNVILVMLNGIAFLIAWQSRGVVHNGSLAWWMPPTGMVAIEALLWAALAVFWRPPAAPAQLVGPCTGCGQTVHSGHAPGRYRTDTGGYLCPARMHLHDRRHQLAQPAPTGERLHPAGRQ